MIKVFNNTLKEDTANKDATTTLGTSDVKFPTQNATKVYIDTRGALYVPLTSLPTRGQMWTDEATPLVGAAITMNPNGNQVYNTYSYQSGANLESAGWGFLCAAGDYTFYVLAIKASNRGKADWYVDNVAKASGVDYYNATSIYNYVHTFTETLTAGYHTLKWIANGNTAPATAYFITTTKVWFKKTAD